MISKIMNISCLESEAAWAFIKIIERLWRCFDWEDENTMVINIPAEDEYMFDFLTAGV